VLKKRKRVPKLPRSLLVKDLMRQCCSHACLSPPQPKPSVRSFRKLMMDFQVTPDRSMSPPPPEPPDACHREVVSEISESCKLKVMILLHITTGFGYSPVLINLWNLNAHYHVWRFVGCSEISILSFSCDSITTRL